jgi:hypothetical protein
MAVSSPALASRVPSLAGFSVVHGQLSGAPSLSGIRVVLYAEPGPLFMKHLHQGERFYMKLVGSATSSATGAYTIRVSHPDAITSSENQEGIVQLWIMAGGHGYASLRGLPTRVADRGTMLAGLYQKPSLTGVSAALTLHHVTGPSVKGHSVAAVDAVATGDCWTLLDDAGQTEGKVGGMWSTIKPVTKKLTYSDGSTTGTSIAISTSTGGGNWSVSGNTGTNAVTNDSATQGFPNSTGNTSVADYTQMEVGVFESCEISADIAAFPYAVNGGASEPAASPPHATYCTYQAGGAGDFVNLHTTKAITYTEGIDLSALGFGVNLSSSTGYSTDTSQENDFSAQGYACGVTNYPLRTTPVGPSAQVADEHSTGN